MAERGWVLRQTDQWILPSPEESPQGNRLDGGGGQGEDGRSLEARGRDSCIASLPIRLDGLRRFGGCVGRTCRQRADLLVERVDALLMRACSLPIPEQPL